RAVRSLEVLEEDPPRPDRQVPDLGVAHLALREADGLPGGRESRVRIARPQVVEHRGVGQLDRVPRPGRRDPPTVEDDQRDEAQTASSAARQIASTDRGPTDAPPTSPRSRSGSGRRRGAVSGWTEPP